MKIKNVYSLIFSMENLHCALEDASTGRRYKPEVLAYNCDAWEKLNELREEILSGKYEIEKYYIFYVHEPKLRMIMSIGFKHRIVQWAIYRVVNPMLVPGYIKDSYGCIPGRGSLGAMQRLKYWLELVNRKDEQWFYLKLDISKYFYRKRSLQRKSRMKLFCKFYTELLTVRIPLLDCLQERSRRRSHWRSGFLMWVSR